MKEKPLRVIPDLHRAVHAAMVHLDQAGWEMQVSQSEAHVLMHLHMSGPTPVKEVQHGFGHKQSTLTSVLNRLERRGFIERKLRAEDRRSFNVLLTDEGEELARSVYAFFQQYENTILANISDDDLRGFRSVVAAFIHAHGEQNNGDE